MRLLGKTDKKLMRFNEVTQQLDNSVTLKGSQGRGGGGDPKI